MNGFAGEGVWSPVIEIGIPEGFGCDSESLAFEFTVNDLNSNFVPGFGEFFSDLLCIAKIVFGSLEFVVENLLNDPSCSWRVEDFFWEGFQLESVSCFGHYVNLFVFK